MPGHEAQCDEMDGVDVENVACCCAFSAGEMKAPLLVESRLMVFSSTSVYAINH